MGPRSDLDAIAKREIPALSGNQIPTAEERKVFVFIIRLCLRRSCLEGSAVQYTDQDRASSVKTIASALLVP